MRAWSEPRPLGRRAEVALVFAAIGGVTFLFLPSPGTFDVSDSFLPWMELARIQGPVAAFAEIGDYPPLAFVLLGLGAILTVSSGLDPHLVLKLMLAAAGLASSATLLVWQRSLLGAFALFLLWWPSAITHGYLDTFFLPFLLGTLWAYERGRLALGTLLFVIAFLIKWQPIILGPFFLVFLWRGSLWQGPQALWRSLSLAAVLAIVILATFGLPLVRAFAFAVNDPYVSGNALNLQWLVTAVLEYNRVLGRGLSPEGLVRLFNRAADLPLLVVTTKLVLLLVYGWLLAGFAESGRSYESFLYCSLVGFFAYFTINTGVHENHLFIAAVLGIVLAGRLAWMTPVAAILVLLHGVNLLAFYGLEGDSLGFVRKVEIDGTLPLAAFSTVLFVVLAWRAPRPTRLIGRARALARRRFGAARDA